VVVPLLSLPESLGSTWPVVPVDMPVVVVPPVGSLVSVASVVACVALADIEPSLAPVVGVTVSPWVAPELELVPLAEPGVGSVPWLALAETVSPPSPPHAGITPVSTRGSR